MWLLLALAAVLCWSGSDLFSKLGTQTDDRFSHWKMVIAVGTVMGIHAIIEIALGTPISIGAIVTYLPASLMYILSMIFGYVGLRYIELSVLSPICNTSGAFAAILCFFLLGQKLDRLSLIGVAVICVGVLCLGIAEYSEDEEARLERQKLENAKYTRSALAFALPILYCVIDSLGTFFDSVILEEDNTFLPSVFGYLEEDTANVAYELTFFLMAILAFVYVVIIKKQPLTWKNDRFKGVTALFETLGQFAYVYALGANAIGAAPVVSSYCVFSVLWSRLFLKERLSWKHYTALILVFLGILLLGVAEGLAE